MIHKFRWYQILYELEEVDDENDEPLEYDIRISYQDVQGERKCKKYQDFDSVALKSSKFNKLLEKIHPNQTDDIQDFETLFETIKTMAKQTKFNGKCYMRIKIDEPSQNKVLKALKFNVTLAFRDPSIFSLDNFINLLYTKAKSFGTKDSNTYDVPSAEEVMIYFYLFIVCFFCEYAYKFDFMNLCSLLYFYTVKIHKNNMECKEL